MRVKNVSERLKKSVSVAFGTVKFCKGITSLDGVYIHSKKKNVFGYYSPRINGSCFLYFMDINSNKIWMKCAVLHISFSVQ